MAEEREDEMLSRTRFLEGYNDGQKDAILDFSDNLLILACAGSGKTRTITGKIAYALAEGIVSPDQVCAVTFTNKAAGEMRDRLKSLVPDAADGVTVRTFHSLGVMLLRRFGDRIGIPRNFVIADDTDSAHFVKTALNLKGKAAGKLARETSSWILDAKEHGCMSGDPEAEKFFHLDDVEYGNDADNMEWNEIFELYEKVKKEASALDFPDLIAYACILVETSEEARSWCHRRYRMVLVDEYQDSNIMQARFLKSFVSPSAQLVVVGDDDQSIYSFRGAVVDNILDFPKEFERVRKVSLERNYRSTSEILEAAGAVIDKNEKRYSKDIVSATDAHGVKPVMKEFRNAYSEALFIAETIVPLLRKGESCAVLYRQHMCAINLKKVLLERRIPFRVAGGQGVLSAKAVKDAMALLRLCINPSDRPSLHRVISASTIGLGETSFHKVVEAGSDVFDASASLSSSGRSSKGFGILHDVLCTLSGQIVGDDHGGRIGTYEEIGEWPVEKLSDGDLLLDAMRILGMSSDVDPDDESDGDSDDPPLYVFAEMLDRRRHTFDPDMVEDYAGGEPTPVQTLQSFLCRSELGDDMGKDDGTLPVLSTMHAAKGLEWDNVFLIGLEDEVIPGRTDSTDGEEEERRIFYVAMTRARRRLWLCTKQEAMVGRMGMKLCTPSRFINEIPKHMLAEAPQSRERTGYGDTIRRPWMGESPVSAASAPPIHIGDTVSYPGKWTGTAIAEEKYNGRRVISVKTDTGGIIKIIEGMGRFIVTPASAE